MIERIEEMPAGTVGLRVDGKVTRDEYREALLPVLRDAVDSGEVRLLMVAGPDFEMAVGAMLEDAKTGISLGLGRHSAWKRCALATDAEWMHRAIHAFGWMSPGEVAVYGGDEVEAAKAWVAG